MCHFRVLHRNDNMSDIYARTLMRPRGIGIDVASRFQVDSRDVSGSRRRERETTR